MEIINTTKDEYKQIVVNPFSGFDTIDFVELNRNKVDEVFYFIFNNGKNRFGLVGGVKNNILKFPFSATFNCFSEITKENRIEYYHDAIKALIKWSVNNDFKKIEINTPPIFYDVSHITKFQNALINNRFNINNYDVNYEFYLDDFNSNYLSNIHRNARKNYNNASKNELHFEKTDDIKIVYDVIKRNREHKGFPLWMSLTDVINTSEIIKSEYFIVTSKDKKPYASALVHHLKDNIVRVVYWGNTPESEEYRPINYLSYNLFNYYKNLGKEIIDIGTSTVNSIPNFGLCDFKESIGCKCSPKNNFYLNLRRNYGIKNFYK